MYDNKKPYQNNDRPRNVRMTFKITDRFVSANNTVVAADSVIRGLETLNQLDVFRMVSIPAQMKKSLLFNDENKRGNMNCGYITKIDTENNNIDIVIYASSVDRIKEIADQLILVPRIRVDRDGNFSTFLSFDLVIAE